MANQFSDHEGEPEIGSYYIGARFYDPDLGRFLQVDPALEFWNSYSYVGNNPVMGTDPSGKAVYQFSRNLDIRKVGWIGAHSVILFIPDNPSDFLDSNGRYSYNGEDFQMGMIGGELVPFMTVAGHEENGNLVAKFNQTADVAAARELLFGGQKTDLSPSGLVEVFPLNSIENAANKPENVTKAMELGLLMINDTQFIQLGIERANNYRKNTANRPVSYPTNFLVNGLGAGTNCHSWMQKFLSMIGVGYDQRSRNLPGYDPGGYQEIEGDLFFDSTTP